MNRCVVLDAEALSSQAIDPKSRRGREVRAAMRQALELNRKIIVPAVVLAELYRGSVHNASVDALLSRSSSVVVRSTDRSLARLVGGVLAAADAGSEMLADAHVIAVAVEQGGGIALTGDPDDLERLAAAFRNVVVVPLP